LQGAVICVELDVKPYYIYTYCMELPPVRFNGVIRELLPINFWYCCIITITSRVTWIDTKLQTQAGEVKNRTSPVIAGAR